MTSLTPHATDHHHPQHRAHRQPTGRVKRLALYTFLPACVSAATVWGLFDIAQLTGGAEPAPAQAPLSGIAQQDRPVQTVGQVVAISPESITTRGGDGTTTTFVITPATTGIGADGSTNPIATAGFSVSDTVTVVGLVDNGTTVATALAEQNSAAGNAPPMDAV
jgi:hypothetical protein